MPGPAVTHAPAEIAAHGNVLQIGIAGGKASRGRGRLIERGVDAAVRSGKARQRFQIGGTHFFQLAEFEQGVHHGMLPGKLFEHRLRRGSLPALGGLGRRKAQLLEKNLAYLLRGADVELLPRLLIDAFGQRVELGLHFVEKIPERGLVDGDARVLHGHQHRNERHFHVVQQAQQPVVFEALHHVVVQGKGDGGRAFHGQTALFRMTGGKAGPAVVSVFGRKKIGGKTEIEAARRRNGAPGRMRVQKTLHVRRHDKGGGGSPGHERPGVAGIKALLYVGALAHGHAQPVTL